MNTQEWEAIAGDVADGLGEVGFEAMILRAGAESGPEFAPTIGPDTEHPCTVLRDEFSQMERSGTQVQAGDQKFMLSTDGLSIEPKVSDRLKIGEKTYQIVDVSPFAPGDVPIYYELQVRK